MTRWKALGKLGARLCRSVSPLMHKDWASISGLKGPYQFAWVGDGVVRQWIHCPESLSCKAHRAPLWTADINLRRQRSGGVWLSSHTTTHISTHRDTHRLSHMHIHYVTAEREDAVSNTASPIIRISFFWDDLHNTFRLQACRHCCRHKVSLRDVIVMLIITKYKEGLVPLIQFSVWLPDQWQHFTSASSA